MIAHSVKGYLLALLATLILVLSAANGPPLALAQKLPTRFCPGLKAISRNPTSGASTTYAEATRIMQRHAYGLFRHCAGLISTGVERVNQRLAANLNGQEWEISLVLLERSVLSGYLEEHLSLDGVDLALNLDKRDLSPTDKRKHFV